MSNMSHLRSCTWGRKGVQPSVLTLQNEGGLAQNKKKKKNGKAGADCVRFFTDDRKKSELLTFAQKKVQQSLILEVASYQM